MEKSKDSGKENQNSNGSDTYKFNRDRCLVLGDYLDILLNRSINTGKYRLSNFEAINYAKEPAKMISSGLSTEKLPADCKRFEVASLPYRKDASIPIRYDDEGSGTSLSWVQREPANRRRDSRLRLCLGLNMELRFILRGSCVSAVPAQHDARANEQASVRKTGEEKETLRKTYEITSPSFMGLRCKQHGIRRPLGVLLRYSEIGWT
jgi:hypothetical protein